LICALQSGVVDQMQIRAEDISPEVYQHEFGIQALGCLRPSDERIHERLARSLLDPREWIARLSGLALTGMRPAE
jgi:hypothetical protein